MIRSDIYRVVRDLRQTVARAVPLGKGFACIRIRVTEREVAAQNVETDLVACSEQIASGPEIDYNMIDFAGRQRFAADRVDATEIVAGPGERPEAGPYDRVRQDHTAVGGY